MGGLGTGDYGIEAMIIDHGEALARIEVHQQNHAAALKEVKSSINEVTRSQSDCPARSGFGSLKSTVGGLEDTVRVNRIAVETAVKTKHRSSLGPLPLPSKTDIIRFLPWAIAAGIGIASAMGWIPSVPAP